MKNNSVKSGTSKNIGFGAAVWTVISWPVRMICRGLRAFWQWVRCIDLIGLVNLTLLLAIIVLFSMLIMDLCKCGRKTVVLVPSESVPLKITESKPTNTKPVEVTPTKKVTITLPLNKNVERNAQFDTVTVTDEKFVAPTMNGDVIIDGDLRDTKIVRNTKINGNLYLQNMRQYTLPCGTIVNGDLFLRNVGMLKFCGDFIVTGNIYVSHNSSFGPIPATSRLGGQVIF